MRRVKSSKNTSDSARKHHDDLQKRISHESVQRRGRNVKSSTNPGQSPQNLNDTQVGTPSAYGATAIGSSPSPNLDPSQPSLSPTMASPSEVPVSCATQDIKPITQSNPVDYGTSRMRVRNSASQLFLDSKRGSSKHTKRAPTEQRKSGSSTGTPVSAKRKSTETFRRPVVGQLQAERGKVGEKADEAQKQNKYGYGKRGGKMKVLVSAGTMGERFSDFATNGDNTRRRVGEASTMRRKSSHDKSNDQRRLSAEKTQHSKQGKGENGGNDPLRKGSMERRMVSATKHQTQAQKKKVEKVVPKEVEVQQIDPLLEMYAATPEIHEITALPRSGHDIGFDGDNVNNMELKDQLAPMEMELPAGESKSQVFNKRKNSSESSAESKPSAVSPKRKSKELIKSKTSSQDKSREKLKETAKSKDRVVKKVTSKEATTAAPILKVKSPPKAKQKNAEKSKSASAIGRKKIKKYIVVSKPGLRVRKSSSQYPEATLSQKVFKKTTNQNGASSNETATSSMDVDLDGSRPLSHYDEENNENPEENDDNAQNGESDDINFMEIKQKRKKHESYRFNFEYYAMLVSLFVGISNLYMFPDRMLKYGGYYYLVPYLVCTFFYAIPVAYIEAYVGQFTQDAPLLGYQKIAPILKLVCWTDTTYVMLNYIRNVVHMMIMLPGLFSPVETYRNTFCGAENTQKCSSLHDDRLCSRNTSFAHREFSITHRFVQKNCLSQNVARTSLIDPFGATSPLHEFFMKVMITRGADIYDMSSFQYKPFLVFVFFVTVVALLQRLSLRVYARIVGVLMTVAGFLLLSFTFHTFMDWPRDVPVVDMFEMFYPRKQKLTELETWAAALEHSILTLSTGQSEISTVASFAKRSTNTIKYVVLAALTDIFFGICAVCVGAGIARLVSGSAVSSVTMTDLTNNGPKSSITYLLNTVPQMMSYYTSNVWIQLFLIMFVCVLFSSMMVSQLYLREFFSALFGVKSQWKRVFLTAGIILCVIFFISFKNGAFIYNWTLNSQRVLYMWSMAAKQVIIIGCYGATQVNLDISFMQGTPKSFFDKMWSKIGRFARHLYFSYAFPITLFYIAGMTMFIDWTDEVHNPIEYLRERPLLAVFINPGMLPAVIVSIIFFVQIFSYEDKSEIFKVQPELPSYHRIRVEIEIFEDEGGKDLDDLRFKNDDKLSREVQSDEKA